MLWEEMIKEEREAAFQDGHASGLTKGLAEGRVEMLLTLSGLKGELSA